MNNPILIGMYKNPQSKAYSNIATVTGNIPMYGVDTCAISTLSPRLAICKRD
jgi:hypothetical protein